MRAVISYVALAAALLLGLGYAGWIHPAGDSFAVFRPQLAGLLLVTVALSAWRMSLKLSLAGAAIWAGTSVVLPWSNPTDAGAGPVLYQQNLKFSRTDHDAWLQAVARADADLLTLQEVSGRNRVILDRLAAPYPTQVYCDFAAVGGVAVLARYPAVAGTRICAEGNGIAAVQVDTPGGPMWLVSLHLHWPWPYSQSEQLDRVVPLLETLQGPIVVGGDFNAVAWSHAVSRVEQSTGSHRIGPQAATFAVRGLPLGIDHVLTSLSGAASVTVQPRLGSDHHGLVAHLPRTR